MPGTRATPPNTNCEPPAKENAAPPIKQHTAGGLPHPLNPFAMDTMTTLSETITKLKKEGYTEDFNLEQHFLTGQSTALKLAASEFTLDSHYRFEGSSDPGDEAVVYAISSAKHNLKGTLVNGYGFSTDAGTDEFIRDLVENTKR